MRVLIDECVDENLRRHVTGHDCATCRYARFKGLTNGRLLAAAESAGFEVLLTVDKNMAYQQNLTGRAISVIVMEPRTTTLDDLIELIPELLVKLGVLQPGEFVRLSRSA